MNRVALFALVLVPAGSYLPFYPEKPTAPVPVHVDSFRMDPYAVTQEEFLAFVQANPEWRKSRVPEEYADEHYLADWPSDLKLRSEEVRKSPVTNVSWHAAEAYCEWKGEQLPTLDQWEYAAADRGRAKDATRRRILEWLSHPNPAVLPPVGSAGRNGYGLHDLHGLIYEWVLDFNSVIQGGDARGKDNDQFCGGGSLGALDATDYPSFMRYGFRSSLKAKYAVANLGFRCVRTTRPAGSVTLWTNQDGRTVKWEDLHGKPLVVAMIYTSCQGACPIIVSDLKRIEQGLSEDARKKIGFALFSMDSEIDQPARLQEYARAHSLDLKHWTLLHGSPVAVRKLASILGVKYRKTAGGMFEHSNLITVLDSRGAIRFQQEGLKQDPHKVVSTIEELIDHRDIPSGQ